MRTRPLTRVELHTVQMLGSGPGLAPGARRACIRSADMIAMIGRIEARYGVQFTRGGEGAMALTRLGVEIGLASAEFHTIVDRSVREATGLGGANRVRLAVTGSSNHRWVDVLTHIDPDVLPHVDELSRLQAVSAFEYGTVDAVYTWRGQRPRTGGPAFVK